MTQYEMMCDMIACTGMMMMIYFLMWI